MRSTIICAIAASLTLAGCAGGGGNGSALPPVQKPTQNPNAKAQSAAQAAMAPVSSGDLSNGLFGGAYGQTLVVGSHARSVKALSATCTNRHEFTVTQISPTETKY